MTATFDGFELLARQAAESAYQRVISDRDKAIGDSPIEQLFFVALRAAASRREHSVNTVSLTQDERSLARQLDLTIERFNPLDFVWVQPQAVVAGWRVDFVLHHYDPRALPDIRLRKTLIECDGHNFHERTKEQAARDRSRDRVAQRAGFPILRFTGAEIWNDPWACADEVLAFLERD